LLFQQRFDALVDAVMQKLRHGASPQTRYSILSAFNLIMKLRSQSEAIDKGTRLQMLNTLQS
jgi:hypothetical protein